VNLISNKGNDIIANKRSIIMPAVTVRNIPETTHRALRLRAAQAGRSTEAEIRYILEEAVQADRPVRIGSEIAALAQSFGGFELPLKRRADPAETAVFD
jgi:antitoxin FitA